MMSDSSAKELLRLAAQTIEVTPDSGRVLAATVQRSRNHGWAIAIGAAVVTCAVTLAVVVAATGRSDTSRVPTPVTSQNPTATEATRAGAHTACRILDTSAAPNDLERRTRVRARDGMPDVVEVTYDNPDLTRGIQAIASWDTDVYGHGLPGPTRDATVMGQPAVLHKTAPDTDVYIWTDPQDTGCPQRAVTIVGLTKSEAARVLAGLQLNPPT